MRCLFEAARQTRHELLLEVIPPRGSDVDSGTVARALDRLYEIGIHPDWWELQPPSSTETWSEIARVIERRDSRCRGILLLGLDAPEEELTRAFHTASAHALCKGFAVGRTIFGAAARSWFAGEIDDDAAVADMAASYGRLIAAWQREHDPAR